MINLIICGGAGTRLWPISTKDNPKQFLKIFNEKSLFEMTLDRNSSLCRSFCVILGEKHYKKALQQTNTDQKIDFVIEPIGRDTAPAIALACFGMQRQTVVFVTPADHLIKSNQNYQKAIQRAEILAKQGFLVTFGIKPTYAETGYGYIHAKDETVLSFKEKPNLSVAKKYLLDNSYFWNSGMFCFSAGSFLDELQKYSPEIYKMAKIAQKNSPHGKIDIKDMLKIPKKSIDYAVMEKSKIVKMVSFDSPWNDLGSFDSLFGILKNQGSCIEIDSKNNLILAKGKTVATIGIENSIIVATEKKILVCKKGKSQKVKDIAKLLDIYKKKLY